MTNCPTCQPSDIACLKHCPAWLLAREAACIYFHNDEGIIRWVKS